ncbi:MAG: nucleotide exchange factor GrpE [Proteobacteria bacterium]|nr:MAG: nucleotide exchange factor GrpE [Pseudomonadota bacterium]
MSSKNKKQDIEDQEVNDSETSQDNELEETTLEDDVLTVDEEGEPIDPMQALENEVAELNDKLLRQHAEMDNLRKRTAREVVDARKFAVEKFAVALLDVVDNLERALDVEEGKEDALRDGVQRTLDSWHGMMGKFDVERIEAVGEQFDPHKHEALSKMPSDEPEGTVINQHCAGYTLNGRLIRPAQVLVSSGK